MPLEYAIPGMVYTLHGLKKTPHYNGTRVRLVRRLDDENGVETYRVCKVADQRYLKAKAANLEWTSTGYVLEWREGKGICVIATRRYGAGEEVVREKPLLEWREGEPVGRLDAWIDGELEKPANEYKAEEIDALFGGASTASAAMPAQCGAAAKAEPPIPPPAAAGTLEARGSNPDDEPNSGATSADAPACTPDNLEAAMPQCSAAGAAKAEPPIPPPAAAGTPEARGSNPDGEPNSGATSADAPACTPDNLEAAMPQCSAAGAAKAEPPIPPPAAAGTPEARGSNPDGEPNSGATSADAPACTSDNLEAAMPQCSAAGAAKAEPPIPPPAAAGTPEARGSNPDGEPNSGATSADAPACTPDNLEAAKPPDGLANEPYQDPETTFSRAPKSPDEYTSTKTLLQDTAAAAAQAPGAENEPNGTETLESKPGAAHTEANTQAKDQEERSAKEPDEAAEQFNEAAKEPFELNEAETKSNGASREPVEAETERTDPDGTAAEAVEAARNVSQEQSAGSPVAASGASSAHDATDDAAAARVAARLEKVKLNVFRTPDQLRHCLSATTSRLNHSCSNNCSLRWDADGQVMAVVTDRAVVPGEELCHSYVAPLQSREQRVVQLLRHWRFACGCSACSLAGEARAASDAARSELAAIYARDDDISALTEADAVRFLHLTLEEGVVLHCAALPLLYDRLSSLEHNKKTPDLLLLRLYLKSLYNASVGNLNVPEQLKRNVQVAYQLIAPQPGEPDDYRDYYFAKKRPSRLSVG
ncbi:hypothetical protein DIPPA_22733 [Diplonema papillatum]|nr:hypothetical protein DIPPA_22733 [Diplonema papillatum]